MDWAEHWQYIFSIRYIDIFNTISSFGDLVGKCPSGCSSASFNKSSLQ
nr:MAG TPA: Nematocyst outer wall antigen evolution, nematocyst, bridge state [Caudoviricetes sp.]